jgi:Transposase domain (DUF772)
LNLAYRWVIGEVVAREGAVAALGAVEHRNSGSIDRFVACWRDSASSRSHRRKGAAFDRFFAARAPSRPGRCSQSQLWFCRLGLDGAVPDRSTFSKNRHGRFRESDLLRKVFETTVRRCMAEGLVGGDGFAALPA